MSESRKATTAQAARQEPPGGHGPPGPVASRLYGIARLRRILQHSPDVPLEQLCEEAALRIADLESRVSEMRPPVRISNRSPNPVVDL